MNTEEASRRDPLARGESLAGGPGRLWAIVLAGGDGARLRPLTRWVCGDDRPKQYAALIDARSLLRQSLDRVALAIPDDRVTVVTHQSHDRYLAAELAGGRRPRVLAQPEDRGTAAGVLFPAHWISWQDPGATVAVFPSDHFILEEAAFMAHVQEVAAFVGRHPERVVLLGARATAAETEYGWIEPAEPIAESAGASVRRVRRFWEKPSKATARACLERGYLWNTFVLIAKAARLIEAGKLFLPDLTDRLSRIKPFAGTDEERWAIGQAYALAPTANFSRAILEPCPPFLAVSPLPALTWSDWGTPDRVLESLRTAGISPAWLRCGA